MSGSRWSLGLIGAVCIVNQSGCPDPVPRASDAGAGGDAAEATCPARNGATVLHGRDVVADETWVGDGTVHVITGGITVRPGATLTLEPCAVVQIAPRLSVSVAGDAATSRPARLVARGTPTRPVTISRKDGAEEGWGTLQTFDDASFLDLSYTTIEGGGTGTAPMVRMSGAGRNLELNPTLRAVSLSLRGAASCALALDDGAAFTADSTAIAITGGGPATAPHVNGDLQITPLAINTLPPIVTIRDNQQDLIHVSHTSVLQIERDVRIRDHGVPYYFYFDSVRVHSRTATPRLTIEAGVHLLFDDMLVVGVEGSTPEMDEPGVLEVLGEPGKEVVFTSFKSSHAPGDWPGIWLQMATGSRISHARIEAAGGRNGVGRANCKPVNSSDNAALLVGGYIPAASDFSDVVIAGSASHGINAVWRSPGFGPDLTAGFTFLDIQGCRQTKNGLPGGNCGDQNGCLVD